MLQDHSLENSPSLGLLESSKNDVYCNSSDRTSESYLFTIRTNIDCGDSNAVEVE